MRVGVTRSPKPLDRLGAIRRVRIWTAYPLEYPAAGHEQAMLGWRVEWLPDMDWLACGQSRCDRAVRAPSPLRFVELRSYPCPSPKLRDNLAARHGFEP